MSSSLHPLLNLDMVGAIEGLKKKEFSVQDLLKAYEQRMEETKGFNIFITPTLSSEQEQKKALESQERYNKGTQRSLEGMPLGIKDAFCTEGVRTTMASRMLHNFVPPYESTCTQRLRNAGSLMTGKLNLDEFCMGSVSNSPYTGPVKNPWRPTHVAGGSSGGPAAVVSCGASIASMGTDTGGSIRQPAAFCGIVGLKPTYGRCSRWGIVAFSSSLDTPGPMGRSVRDMALLLEVLAGKDPKDATTTHHPVPSYSSFLNTSLKGKVVGIPEKICPPEEMHKDIANNWQKTQDFLKSEGCILKTVSLPYLSYSLHTYYVLACAEAASNLMRYDGLKYGFQSSKNCSQLEDLYTASRSEGFGAEVKRRILIGTYVLSGGYYDAYYSRAQQVRHCIQRDFHRVFQDVDVLLTPTTPTPTFSFDSIGQDPVKMYYNDIFTVPVNIADLCGMSVPTGFSSCGLPIGMQLIAPGFQEERLFSFGSLLEKMQPFTLCPNTLGA